MPTRRKKVAGTTMAATEGPPEVVGASEATPEPMVLPLPPTEPDALRAWIEKYTGLQIPNTAVCDEHHSPWEWFEKVHLDRLPIALVIGARGSGKSFLSALDTHLSSLRNPKQGTRILGGSKAQSAQIYQALRDIVGRVRDLSNDDEAGGLERLRKDEALYENGSEVAILAASSRSVRGPHVASLKLDEVDEIDVEVRDAALGMCMAKRGVPASVVMTSTWHRPHGPMTHLIDRARAGDFPLFTTCVFEVLERCSDERSGPNLEKCPSCPLKPYCHDTRDDQFPKAKRSNGHYAIDSLIQKVRTTGRATFEADFLCKGPRSDSLWFPNFSVETHVSEEALYHPRLPLYLAIDPGVTTGAVFFQVHKDEERDGTDDRVMVVADYLAEGVSAERNAIELQSMLRVQFANAMVEVRVDPAGNSRTAFGMSVVAEYQRAGIKEVLPWPRAGVLDGLALVESFVNPAQGASRLKIHPRCKPLIEAFQNYRRLKRAGQFEDRPLDPQHPFEDMLDPLRGGLKACYPDGRRVAPQLTRVPANKVF